MITKTKEKFGAAINLYLTAPAAELVQEVNRLFNFGVISAVPESFEEGVDTHVMVQSDPQRFERGHVAMAVVECQRDKALCATYKGKGEGFNAAAKELAGERMAEFTDEGYANYEKRAAHVYTTGTF